jgi:hypothetical protein
MNHERIFQLWSNLMARKKVKPDNKNADDSLRVQLIPTAFNKDEATQTKESAQKILSLMFAALYKRGRPKNETKEVTCGI